MTDGFGIAPAVRVNYRALARLRIVSEAANGLVIDACCGIVLSHASLPGSVPYKSSFYWVFLVLAYSTLLSGAFTSRRPILH